MFQSSASVRRPCRGHADSSRESAKSLNKYPDVRDWVTSSATLRVPTRVPV